MYDYYSGSCGPVDVGLEVKDLGAKSQSPKRQWAISVCLPSWNSDGYELIYESQRNIGAVTAAWQSQPWFPLLDAWECTFTAASPNPSAELDSLLCAWTMEELAEVRDAERAGSFDVFEEWRDLLGVLVAGRRATFGRLVQKIDYLRLADCPVELAAVIATVHESIRPRTGQHRSYSKSRAYLIARFLERASGIRSLPLHPVLSKVCRCFTDYVYECRGRRLSFANTRPGRLDELVKANR